MSEEINKTVVLEDKPSLSNKDLFKTYIRLYITNEMSNSYERLQAQNCCITLAPHLKKWYGDRKEAYIESLQRHMQFFNTECTVGAVIYGVVLSMEEKKAKGAPISGEAITSIKTGLMGPMAGIGDSLIRSTLKTTILAIACSFALQGNAIGAFIPWLYPVIIIMMGYLLLKLGYTLGRDAITRIMRSGLFANIIQASGVLGMFMIGALSSSYVKVSTPLSFALANASAPIVVQDILNKILPGMLPLAAVLGIYTYISRGGRKYSQLVWILFAIAVVGSLIGVLA